MRRICREVTVPQSFSLRVREEKGHKCAQLRDVVDVAHTCRSRDLGGILFISIELRVNVFRDLREGVRSVFRPKKVFCIEVIGLLLWRRDRDAIQLHFEAVRDEGLICPTV
jgi:hypothetical protein